MYSTICLCSSRDKMDANSPLSFSLQLSLASNQVTSCGRTERLKCSLAQVQGEKCHQDWPLCYPHDSKYFGPFALIFAKLK